MQLISEGEQPDLGGVGFFPYAKNSGKIFVPPAVADIVQSILAKATAEWLSPLMVRHFENAVADHPSPSFDNSNCNMRNFAGHVSALVKP